MKPRLTDFYQLAGLFSSVACGTIENMSRIILLFVVCLFRISASSQYSWKLEKNKEGIMVYTSPSPNSSYKAVRVECTFPGTYNKLISILNDVPKFEDWIYHNKRAFLIKKNSIHDFTYYSETSMPWPLDNRDVVLRLTINTDSLPKFLLINGQHQENILPKVPFMVRVPKYTATWKVTMPAPNQLHISYILDVNPGGSIPTAVVNMFVDKGPYETFRNLSEELRK